MKHPSIRRRLTIGTGLLVAAVLFAANFLIYGSIRSALLEQVDRQLLQSASLLAKSAELEANALDYEWQEAMKSAGSPDIEGVFAFWDLASGRITKSPELGDRDLPLFHGELNQPKLGEFTFKDGRKARIAGLLHHPFTDQESIDLAASMGKTLRPSDHPQVVVVARETDSLTTRLHELRSFLFRSTVITLLAIWAAIFAIFTWCLRPIREFSENLLSRSESDVPSASVIPDNLPSELVGLAGTFNTALDRVEKSRDREKEFALHAAHELRTPVSGVFATLEQAANRPRSSEDLLHRVREAIGLLAGIRVTLDSLMRLARLRGGLEKSTVSSFDPAPVVDSILESLSDVTLARNLIIHREFPAPSADLRSDSGLFKVIASNLIENAVRHAPEGSRIDIHLSGNHGTGELTVANPSPGATLSGIDRWFEPFQRGSSAADNEGGHAGLGLSLAREAAALLGGTLTATLTGNDILIFTLRIPA